MNPLTKIYQALPSYNPKYDPINFLNIRDNEYHAYREITSEYMLDDKDDKGDETVKEKPEYVEICIRDYREADTYRSIGHINIFEEGLYISALDFYKLDILHGTNYIVYFRLSDIYNMKIRANVEQDLRKNVIMMLNIFFYMYRITERNNKILAGLKC